MTSFRSKGLGPMWGALLAAGVLRGGSASAATFCVSNATELTNALNTADSNGVDDTIRLVQGTYVGKFRHVADEGLTIEGGYTASCASRSVNAANTILDGNATADRTLVLFSNVPVAYVVDAVTIRNGRALGSPPGVIHGAGLYAIAGNVTPGGSLVLRRSVISGNQAFQDGGGVYVYKADTVTLTGNLIQGNSSGFGGGVYVTDCRSIQLTGNTLTANTVSFASPEPGGAALYVDSTYPNIPAKHPGGTTTLALVNNTINSNNGGNGVFVFALATPNDTSASITAVGNTFSNNIGRDGAGLAAGGNGRLFVGLRNTWTGNQASNNGGALSLATSIQAFVVDNVFNGNTAAASGGGLYANQPASLVVTNNTFNNNRATSGGSFGGGLWLALQNDSDRADIDNNIFFNNSAGSGATGDLAINNDGNANTVFSPVSLLNNDFNQALAGFFINQGSFVVDPSNLDNENPLFVNAAVGDFHLQALSPCINQGTAAAPGLPGLDREGRYRLAPTTVDMGAHESASVAAFKRRILDFDGDGRSDVTVYHAASGNWYVRQSMIGSVFSLVLGGPGYTPVAGDYDGDGKTDIAVYHAASALWFIRQSSTGTTLTVGFGGTGYTPVAGDYDGDGKTDIAAYHEASGLWFLRQSSTGTTATIGYGGPGYLPIPEDYDGDGKADVAVYHAASGLWFIRRSSNSTTFSIGFGGPGYTPLAWDFDADGKADISVYHQASGLWFMRQSSTGTTATVGYGGSGYAPVPAYYDTDGNGDVAVYHSASGLWFLRQSSTLATQTVAFGGAGFQPVN